MQLLELNCKSENIENLKDIYYDSIPDNERIEFRDMIKLSFPNSRLLGVFDKKMLVGFTYLCVCNDFVYIVYLAIQKSKRNKGLGSKVLKKLENIYKNKSFVLCVEKPKNNNDIGSRRIEFYKRNGFLISGLEFNYYGVDFQVMFNGEFNKVEFTNLLLLCFPECSDLINIS